MRNTFEEFCDHCHTDTLSAYALKDKQSPPETYDELVDLVAYRLGLSDPKFSVESLVFWLMSTSTRDPNYGSLAEDVENVTSVILLGELDKSDEFVARFPVEDSRVMIPPVDTVRALVIQQQSIQF